MTDTTPRAEAEDKELVATLVVAALEAAEAPGQVGVFRADRDGYLAGHPSGGPPADEELDFGIEVVAPLIPLAVAAAKAVISVITDAFAASLQDEMQTTFSQWLHRVLHPRSGDGDGHGEPAPLPGEVLERVRTAAYDVSRRMGADEDDAEVMAKAIVGTLAVGPVGRPQAA
ncbi:hypothetical protein AB0C76_38055 [Kitasatospora sp. NPDC048722]|uniref:hypothetical protein n=1 Tax=Kitasatospora sp. NPDC048722 TaxID=3155639 RepID=UPI0033E971D8